MVFLTGGTGFLGSYLLPELLRRGHRVRALRREQRPVPFLPAEVSEKIEWVHGDLLDVCGLNEYLRDCDRIIHAAALVSFHPEDRKKLYKINIEGTANLVNAALENHVTDFVHISSVGALGPPDAAGVINEEQKWENGRNQSHYAISKYFAEMEVWRGMGEGLQPVIVNPSTLIGYGDWTRGSCAIFKTVYDEFPWYVNGCNGFVDAGDVARAVVRLMESPLRNERFIVSAENRSYRQLFHQIADEFGKRPPSREATPFLAGLAWRMEKLRSFFRGKKPLLTQETAAIARKQSVYDNGKLLRALPGFQYRPLEDSIRDACSAYLKQLEPEPAMA